MFLLPGLYCVWGVRVHPSPGSSNRWLPRIVRACSQLVTGAPSAFSRPGGVTCGGPDLAEKRRRAGPDTSVWLRILGSINIHGWFYIYKLYIIGFIIGSSMGLGCICNYSIRCMVWDLSDSAQWDGHLTERDELVEQ